MLSEGRIATPRLSLQVRRAGSGQPLLFLGGSNTDMRLRAPVFQSALVGHFEVAAYEPRGLGRSDSPPGDWTMADYAADAVALLDALGWGRVDMVGESFGAMTALELAIRYPGRVGRLCLMVGAPGGAGGSSYPIETLLPLEPRERAIAALGIMDTRFQGLLHTSPAEAEAQVMARLRFDRDFLGDAGNAQGYPRLLAARAQHDVWGRLGQIQADTWVVSGHYDGQAPADYGQAMAGRIPDARFRVFMGGHTLAFATPEPVDWLLGQWGLLR